MKRLLQPWVVATLVAGSFLMRLPDGIGDGGLGGAKALALAPKAPAKTNASANKKEPRNKQRGEFMVWEKRKFGHFLGNGQEEPGRSQGYGLV